MAICKKCGAEVMEGALFCTECGEPITSSSNPFAEFDNNVPKPELASTLVFDDPDWKKAEKIEEQAAAAQEIADSAAKEAQAKAEAAAKEAQAKAEEAAKEAQAKAEVKSEAETETGFRPDFQKAQEKDEASKISAAGAFAAGAASANANSTNTSSGGTQNWQGQSNYGKPQFGETANQQAQQGAWSAADQQAQQGAWSAADQQAQQGAWSAANQQAQQGAWSAADHQAQQTQYQGEANWQNSANSQQPWNPNDIYTEEYRNMPQGSDKIWAVLSYIGVIVWIIGFILSGRNGQRSNYLTHHLNQSLVLKVGAIIIGWVSYLIPSIGILSVLVFVLEIMGIISAAQGSTKELPIVGTVKIIK